MSDERQIKYSYKPVPTLRRFAESDTFIRGIIGPFGSGKSSGCVIECVNRANNQAIGPDGVRRVRVAVVRNTYPQLKDTTIKTFHDWLPPHYFGQYNQTAHDYFVNNLIAKDGSPIEMEVMFRALDRPDHVRNLLSMELSFAWFNEVREIPRMIFDAMQGRVGRYPSQKDGGCTWSGIFADTNPPDTDHWFYDLFEVKKPRHPNGTPMTEIFHQPSGRSPEAENLANLPKDYYVKMAVGKSLDFIRVYIDGEYGFVSDGKPVYPNWNPVIHISSELIKPVKALPLIIGFDFALHPACVIIQQIPKGPRLNILEEWVGQDITVRRFLQEIVLPQLNSKYMGMEWYVTGDPSGTKRQDTDERNAFLELRDNGLPAIPARSNTLIARLPAVDNWLTQWYQDEDPETHDKKTKASFQVSPNCKTLIRGFNGGYRMRRLMVVGQERFMDKPEKSLESHPHDALQYACMLLETGIRVRRTISRQHHEPQPPPPKGAWT